MKKTCFIILFLLCCLTVHSQTPSEREEFVKAVFQNYSADDLKKKTELVKANPNVYLQIENAWIIISEKSNLYGAGLSKFPYLLPSDGETQIGFCQGWTANFFFMKQRGSFRSTEYITLWEVGQATIINENGTKYLMIYPIEGKTFEKRTWYGNSGTNNGTVSSIKFYLDWSLEEGLINTFCDNLNI